MHLHVAYFIAALVGFVVGVTLTYPVAVVVAALITSTGLVAAAYIQSRRKK